MADEEGGARGGEGGGGDDEVAFVFAGGGVEDDDGVAGAYVGEGEDVRRVRKRSGRESGLEGWREGRDARKASMASGMVSKSRAPLVVAMVDEGASQWSSAFFLQIRRRMDVRAVSGTISLFHMPIARGLTEYVRFVVGGHQTPR